MKRDRMRWFEDEGDLQVFVPGLMATGILVSVVMLVWDAIKRFIPDIGRRQRAARLSMQAAGRVNDLTSVEQGEPPHLAHVDRVRRSRGVALLMAIATSTAAAAVAFITLGAYYAEHGTLAGRGWTLTFGMGTSGALLVFAGLWLITALADGKIPGWLERAEAHWPIGVLPEPSEDDVRP